MESVAEREEQMVQSEWRKLDESGVKKLQDICKTLNKYYSSIQISKSETFMFRERFVSIEPSEVQHVAIKHFGEYEYFVSVKISDDDKDQWIHIDGIAEERNLFKDRKNHPVFSIVCLGDIYSNSTAEENYTF